MAYKLVCVHPFHNYVRGQEITDPDEVAKLSEDREHHFVRVAMPELQASAPSAEPPQE